MLGVKYFIWAQYICDLRFLGWLYCSKEIQGIRCINTNSNNVYFSFPDFLRLDFHRHWDEYKSCWTQIPLCQHLFNISLFGVWYFCLSSHAVIWDLSGFVDKIILPLTCMMTLGKTLRVKFLNKFKQPKMYTGELLDFEKHQCIFTLQIGVNLAVDAFENFTNSLSASICT